MATQSSNRLPASHPKCIIIDLEKLLSSGKLDSSRWPERERRVAGALTEYATGAVALSKSTKGAPAPPEHWDQLLESLRPVLGWGPVCIENCLDLFSTDEHAASAISDYKLDRQGQKLKEIVDELNASLGTEKWERNLLILGFPGDCTQAVRYY